MQNIIYGNLCSLGAMLTDSISGTRKKQKEILAIQIISQVFYAASSAFLKGYSATVQNLLAIFRNLLAMGENKKKYLEYILIGLGVVLGFIFNNRGVLGWLPIIANFEYSIAVFRFKDNERALKISFVINALMFTVFSIVIQNYVGIISNTVVAVTTVIALIKEKTDSKKEEQE